MGQNLEDSPFQGIEHFMHTRVADECEFMHQYFDVQPHAHAHTTEVRANNYMHSSLSVIYRNSGKPFSIEWSGGLVVIVILAIATLLHLIVVVVAHV